MSARLSIVDAAQSSRPAASGPFHFGYNALFMGPLERLKPMTLPEIVKTAVHQSFGEALAAEIGDLVVKETRRALQERESDLTALVRDAVHEAVAELMNGGPK